jgi:hypothetical protein
MSGKSRLKGRHSHLQPHGHFEFSGGTITYTLYELQANETDVWLTGGGGGGGVIKPFLPLTTPKLSRRRGT